MLCTDCPFGPVASRLGFRTPVKKDTGTLVRRYPAWGVARRALRFGRGALGVALGAWRVGDGGDDNGCGFRWTTVVTRLEHP